MLLLCVFLFSCKKKSDSGDSAKTNIVIAGEFVQNSGYESICKTTENNIAIVAMKSYTHLYVAMLNPGLSLLWEKTFDEKINNAGGITGTDDGGIIVACNQFVPDSTQGGKYCLDLRKLDSKGDLQWEKKYSFLSLESVLNYPIRETSDKGFIIGELNTRPDTISLYYPTLFKINSLGDSLWSKTAHNLFNCYVSDIGIASDGGFLVESCGLTYKTDSLGNILWQTYGGATLQVLPDGSFTVLKVSEFNFEYPELYKADPFGNKIWEQIYPIDQSMEIHNICLSGGNGYMFTYRDYYHSVWMVKTDEQGNKLSETQIGDLDNCGVVLVQNKYYIYNLCNSHTTHYYSLVVRVVE